MGYLRSLQLRRMDGRRFAADTGTGAGGAPTGENQAVAEGADVPDGHSADAGAKERQGADKAFTQADIDRILAREQAKWKRGQEKAISEARTEAERLATMSADERTEAERVRREAAIAQREQEITRRELHAQALEELAVRGLPRDLSGILNYKDADACSASIEATDKAFRAAVQSAVDERLRGQLAPKGAGSVSTIDYNAEAQKAQAAGNVALAAHYTRLAGEKK